jgi:hypothetical protein
MANQKRAPASVLAPFVERLYGEPLERFTAARKELAGELRARGAGEEAAELARMKKPSRTAWALGRVARKHGEALASFLRATERLRDAQKEAMKHGKVAPMREASRALHGEIAAVVALAKKELAASGGEASVAQLRAITRSLQAVPFASRDEVERLTKGTLVDDIDAPSDFGVFGPAPPSSARAASSERETRVAERDDARASDAKKSDAKKRDAKAEKRAAAEAKRRAAAEARRAREEKARLVAAARQADAVAKRLEAAAEKAMRAAEAAAEEAEAAAARARKARDEAIEARRSVDAAE